MSIFSHGMLQALLYRTQPLLLLLFALLGLISLTNLTLSLLRSLHSYFLRRPKDLKALYGPWALVTGPTDGIGRSIAFELARAGLHLVLVGRSPHKLSSLSAALAASFPSIATRHVELDLSSAGPTEVQRRIREGTEGADVGLVVNNAGMGTAHAEYFHERDVETWMEMVRVNLVAPTAVAKAAVEGMMERKRKSGTVVNIGSGSATAIPSYPLYDIYAATKAYLVQLSRCLHHEYKPKGIDVQCQIPMFVDTKLIKDLAGVDRSSIFVASPEGYARAAVRWIGHGVQCVPYFPHFIECCIASLVPDSIQNAEMLKENLSQRKAASS